MSARTALLLTAFAALAVPATAQQPAAKAAPTDLTDPEVAHVAVTANTIDVELGRVAEKRAENEEVRAFAKAMISAHTGVNKLAADLAARLKVTPADNEVSQGLQKGAGEAAGRLATLRGAAFDRAYIAREVVYHQAVLEALDGLLVPTTENVELKTLLEQVRPAIEGHLVHAKQIQSRIGGVK